MRDERTKPEADAARVERIDARAVGVELRGEEPAIAVVRRLNDDGARSVAEEHDAVANARVSLALLGRDFAILESDGCVPAVLPRHERSVHIAADEKDARVLSAANERVGEVEAVEKSGTLLADVEGWQRLAKAHLRLDDWPVAGEEIVGRHRGEDQRIDVVMRPSRGLERPLGGHDAEVRGGLAGIGVVPLLDAAARPYPLVGGIHDAGELFVRYDVLRNADPAAGNHAFHGWQSIHGSPFATPSRIGGNYETSHHLRDRPAGVRMHAETA